MASEEVEVVIAPDGTVSMKVLGIKGDACLVATHALEQALGGEVLERELTSEAYEQPEQTQEQQHHSHGGSW